MRTATTQGYLRYMLRQDLDAVVAIDKDLFDFPWTKAEFVLAMQQKNTIGMVVERNEEVVGYMVYEIHRHKIHVLNFAVRARSQRLGIGRELVERLKSRLHFKQREMIVTEVRESNLDAQLFFKSQGFKCTSILHGFYHPEHTLDAAYKMIFIDRSNHG